MTKERNWKSILFSPMVFSLVVVAPLAGMAFDHRPIIEITDFRVLNNEGSNITARWQAFEYRASEGTITRSFTITQPDGKIVIVTYPAEPTVTHYAGSKQPVEFTRTFAKPPGYEEAKSVTMTAYLSRWTNFVQKHILPFRDKAGPYVLK